MKGAEEGYVCAGGCSEAGTARGPDGNCRVFVSVPEGGLSPRWLRERNQAAVGGGRREGRRGPAPWPTAGGGDVPEEAGLGYD